LRLTDDAPGRSIGGISEYAAVLDTEFLLWLKEYSDREGISLYGIDKNAQSVNEIGGLMHISE